MRFPVGALAVLLAVLVGELVAGAACAGSEGDGGLADYLKCRKTHDSLLPGVNATGTIQAYNPRLRTRDIVLGQSICLQGTLPTFCPSDAASYRIDGTSVGEEAIWKVYCTFPHGSGHRLMGVYWGLLYDPTKVVITRWGSCGDFELPDATWPATGTGNSVIWNTVQLDDLVPLYWFSAYALAPTTIRFNPDMSCGGPAFGDDGVPAYIDRPAGLGAMGFDMPGVRACPQSLGACCEAATGICRLVYETTCSQGWSGETSCTPNPCPVPIGACCNAATGACTLVLLANCADAWMGTGTVCSPSPCPQPPMGVCCVPATGTCSMTIEVNCVDPSVWHSNWTSCASNPCLVVPTTHWSWGRIKRAYR